MGDTEENQDFLTFIKLKLNRASIMRWQQLTKLLEHNEFNYQFMTQYKYLKRNAEEKKNDEFQYTKEIEPLFLRILLVKLKLGYDFKKLEDIKEIQSKFESLQNIDTKTIQNRLKKYNDQYTNMLKSINRQSIETKKLLFDNFWNLDVRSEKIIRNNLRNSKKIERIYRMTP